jgi:hypothetical protein
LSRLWPGAATTRPADEAAITVSPAAAEPEAADDGLVADAVSIKDPKNDLVNEDGKKVKRVPHVDITRLYAWANGAELRVTLRMAGDVPDEMSSVRQELNYLVMVEADESGSEDYWLMLTNQEDGSWAPELTDLATGQGRHGDDFPGYHVIADNELSFSVSLTALGSPSSLRLSAITQKADHETGRVEAEDQAPKGEQYIPADAWLKLAP